ncbi:hypothetical protein Poly59_22450 [Rubripirellula reticaptiva]|uniref:Exonuclease domain-containing protein n=1 Tax=Rubripirellula reticaptiva TaxID=2528013 RepID=A0A5C6F4B2_9BACT|nr:hypothetical protein Poly59_22450 [Rubripirellula reticaptiva]
MDNQAGKWYLRCMEPKTVDQRLVFFDLIVAGNELTHPIIQFAAIAVDEHFGEIDRFETKIRFRQKDVEQKSLFGGIYDRRTWRHFALPELDALQRAQSFLRRHSAMGQFADDETDSPFAQLVAYDATMKSAFLDAWFARHHAFFPASMRPLCTMQRATWLLYEDRQMTPISDFRFATLADYFGVELRQTVRHDLLACVEANIGIFRAMQRWMPKRSETNLSSRSATVLMATNSN